MYGPGPDPAPNRRPTHVRKHAIPAAADALLTELHVVDPPPDEWAWVWGLVVRVPKPKENP